jgi:predicted nuclease of predicted toxin-antitoxin system
MKVIVDSCVWRGVSNELKAAGHEVVWVGDWPRDPGDNAILAYAYENQRVLVTLDRDFGELVIVYGHPHCGIIRLVDISWRSQGAACASALRLYANELNNGAILTIDPDRVRVRPGDAT